jgi:hypothetical protein
VSHLFAWVCLVVGIVIYRLIGDTGIPFMEHAAGVYFAGAALFIHWFLSLAASLAKGDGS